MGFSKEIVKKCKRKCKSCLGQPGRRILDLKRLDFYWFIDFMLIHLLLNSQPLAGDTMGIHRKMAILSRVPFYICTVIT